jgi:hypothetical protein
VRDRRVIGISRAIRVVQADGIDMQANPAGSGSRASTPSVLRTLPLPNSLMRLDRDTMENPNIDVL